MVRFRGIVASVVVSSAALSTSPPAFAQDESWVAVALATAEWNGGYGVADTAENATAIAIGECQKASGPNSVCIVAEVIQFGCIAYAEHPDGSWSTATGPFPAPANVEALSKLAPGGNIVFNKCSTPPG